MASFFPGATDVDQFWANILEGTDSVTEVPAERWDVERYYDPESTLVDAGKTDRENRRPRRSRTR